MADHIVRKGLNIPIEGGASGEPVAIARPSTVAYAPEELRGFMPRPILREGAPVKVGSPVLHEKRMAEMVLRSPVSGSVLEIRRGNRRVITDFVITAEGEDAESLPTYDLGQIAAFSREKALEVALSSGWWPALRQRPLSEIAKPSDTPQSIFIVGTETGPLMPSASVLVSADDKDALQAAAHLFKKLTDGPVYLTTSKGGNHPAFSGLQGVDTHSFDGPHPSGDAAVQINLVDPPRGAHRVWYISAWDAVSLGRTLLSGRFSAERVIAAVGVGCKQPRLVRTVLGAPLTDVVGDALPGNMRWIRGSVLTGGAVGADRWTGFYSRAVHVLPEEVPRYLLGWALPALGRWSSHKAFLSGFIGGKGADMRPGVNGGERALVPVGGVYDKVVATPDLLADYLLKSIVAGDLEESIALGLLDMSEEEAALCTFVCPSKLEFDVLLKQGLDQYKRQA